MDSDSTTSRNGKQYLTYQWLAGLLMAGAFGTIGVLLEAGRARSAMEHQHIMERREAYEAYAAPFFLKVTANTERLAVIEWQLRMLEKRMDAYERGRATPPP